MARSTIFYDSGQLRAIGKLVNERKQGLWTFYHINGQKYLECNYHDGINQGSYKECYENGQVTEEGKYANAHYSVVNFWLENGQQLLKSGSGKAIRKFGSSEGDVYEQYYYECAAG